jgi:signal transduction histidine kinase
MKFTSTLSQRLLVAFASMLVVFAMASYLALAGLAEYQQGMHTLRRHESGARAALLLANAVRDQLSPIVGEDLDGTARRNLDASHERVLALSGRVREQATELADLATLDELDRVRSELDEVARAPDPASQFQSARKLEAIKNLALRLSQRFEASIGSLDEHTAGRERETYRLLLILLIGAMLLAICVGLYIGRSVTRPMALLEQGAIRLASGDLSTHINLDSQDEFGRLAQQFNRMTTTLRDHQQKMLQSERLAAIGRFAAGVAHEINNPLGVILGYVKVIRKSAKFGIDQDLQIIEEEAVRCQQIVDGLLDLARPVERAPRAADLRAIAEEVMVWLKGAGMSVTTEIDLQGEGVAAGNPEKLWQVLTNLMKNAVEASSTDGKVRVNIHGDGATQVVLTVEDNGPGLSKDEPDRLFEPFYSTKPTGTGLGLAVSRAIVQAHGGSLETGKSALGGAKLTIRLPAWIGEVD